MEYKLPLPSRRRHRWNFGALNTGPPQSHPHGVTHLVQLVELGQPVRCIPAFAFPAKTAVRCGRRNPALQKDRPYLSPLGWEYGFPQLAPDTMAYGAVTRMVACSNYSGLIRPVFTSRLATSALRTLSIKLDKLRFSCFAIARSLVFRARSNFKEIVASFISTNSITSHLRTSRNLRIRFSHLTRK
jgi:hypothetical protein